VPAAGEIEVTAEAAGERLDRFLAGRIGSRARAQRLIEEGLVLVDGQAQPKRHVLRGGERVSVAEPPPPRPGGDGAGETAAFTVRFCDEHLLVVDKPAGVVVHPARGHRSGTLSQALAQLGASGGDAWRPGIVHRLDRDTSGLLAVARSETVHSALKALLAAREMRREYLALVRGHPPARTGTIDAPVGRDRHNRLVHSIDTDVPREARTHYEIEQLLPQHALLRVRLETGRTHQIRVHLAAIGHPVVGDATYGAADGLALGRQFLHAARLSFPHPVDGRPVDVASALPDDLAAALERAASPDRGASDVAAGKS
jgi:23S rRNA pseudouridine1911/1915/1917 synthase